jgi:hypothetical protein
MLLIGSQALSIELNKLEAGLGREPVDIDIIARPEDARAFIAQAKLIEIKADEHKWIGKAPDGRMIEIERARYASYSSASLYLDYAERMTDLPTVEFYGHTFQVASLPMLYSLKRSHRHSPRAFEKHVMDYALLRKYVKTDMLSKITAIRYKETVERERLKTPSLNKTTKDFFDDRVSNRTFIHDQIHEVMAFGERPLFEKIKVDPNKVACDKEKFMKLKPLERIRCVQEEAYVIALERGIIPMLFEGERIALPLNAYKWALMRICTTLCSGWFREFALENYELLLFMYHPDYVEKFLRAVESGRIKRIEQSAKPVYCKSEITS